MKNNRDNEISEKIIIFNRRPTPLKQWRESLNKSLNKLDWKYHDVIT